MFISECTFNGLPSEDDLKRCNPRVEDLRIRNPGGTVLCTKGGHKKNGFGDRRCYYQVRFQAQTALSHGILLHAAPPRVPVPHLSPTSFGSSLQVRDTHMALGAVVKQERKPVDKAADLRAPVAALIVDLTDSATDGGGGGLSGGMRRRSCVGSGAIAGGGSSGDALAAADDSVLGVETGLDVEYAIQADEEAVETAEMEVEAADAEERGAETAEAEGAGSARMEAEPADLVLGIQNAEVGAAELYAAPDAMEAPEPTVPANSAIASRPPPGGWVERRPRHVSLHEDRAASLVNAVIRIKNADIDVKVLRRDAVDLGRYEFQDVVSGRTWWQRLHQHEIVTPPPPPDCTHIPRTQVEEDCVICLCDRADGVLSCCMRAVHEACLSRWAKGCPQRCNTPREADQPAHSTRAGSYAARAPTRERRKRQRREMNVDADADADVDAEAVAEAEAEAEVAVQTDGAGASTQRAALLVQSGARPPKFAGARIRVGGQYQATIPDLSSSRSTERGDSLVETPEAAEVETAERGKAEKRARAALAKEQKADRAAAATAALRPRGASTPRGQDLVGRRIRLWWAGDGRWYAGVVSSWLHSRGHSIACALHIRTAARAHVLCAMVPQHKHASRVRVPDTTTARERRTTSTKRSGNLRWTRRRRLRQRPTLRRDGVEPRAATWWTSTRARAPLSCRRLRGVLLCHSSGSTRAATFLTLPPFV